MDEEVRLMGGGFRAGTEVRLIEEDKVEDEEVKLMEENEEGEEVKLRMMDKEGEEV